MKRKSFKYKICKNVIDKNVTSFLTDYYFMKQQIADRLQKNNYLPFYDSIWGHWSDQQAPNTYSCYGDLISETLLVNLLPLIEKNVGKKILPTYSYMRIYKKGDELKRHKDRPECEISATLNLGGDFWPIYFKEKDKKEIKVNLKNGDLAIYKGCELEHWREPFEGEYCVQVFLHYADEKNQNLLFDGREMLGLPKQFRLLSNINNIYTKKID